MRTKRSETRERLITAASGVFARKEYHKATIAEICGRANINLAAVNYYFNDKETLYREAWRYAFREGVKVHPIDGGVADDAPPEERLRGFIESLILRATDRNDKESLIVHMEMANPTGLLEEVMKNELEPTQKKLETIIGELLGPAFTPERARHCGISIMNQCHHPMLRRMTDSDVEIPDGHRLDVPAYIEHVVRFSIGGIRAITEAVHTS